MDRQGSLTPRQVRGVREIVNFDDPMRDRLNAEVGDPTFYNDALAVYDHRVQHILVRPLDVSGAAATVQRCRDSGWFAQCGHDAIGIEALIAHEYGHHLTFRGLMLADRAVQTDFWERVGRALGVSGIPASGSRAALDHWIVQNGYAIGKAVSRYGASNSFELLAEIWQEYSTAGAAARGPIKIIGDLLRQIAEAEA